MTWRLQEHATRGLTAVFASIAVAGCPNQKSLSEEALAGAKAWVTASAFRQHMKFLAADSLEGREAGTDAYATAAAYVADAFRKAELEPFGDGGTYFQSVKLLEARLIADSATLVLHKAGADTTMTFGVDFVRSGGFGDAYEEIAAPLVFVGYGITAPEYGHDDFAGIDVAGSVLVALTGAPPRFATDERAFYSSSDNKIALAAQLGAIGIISVRTPVDQQRLPWSRYLAAIGSPEMRWVDADDRPHDAVPELPGNAMLSESGARMLFDLSGHSIDEIFAKYAVDGVGGFDLGVSVSMTRKSVQRIAVSPNVVGLLRGSDSALHEYVVFTAHLDHLGIRPGSGADSIHNGAYDNAAGVAAILEIAGAMSSLPSPPRRSVIFVGLTAEEKGLRGSDYFVNRPPVPIEQIVANINIDMPYLGFPIADVEAFGVEHSTLKADLLEAATHEGLQLTPDSRPELVRFIRSDQYSFVQKGIPGLNLKPGSQSADAAIDGEAMLKNFLGDHYHQPSDDLELPFSPEGSERFVRTALHFGLIVASRPDRPAWNPGDFFAAKFATRSDDSRPHILIRHKD